MKTKISVSNFKIKNTYSQKLVGAIIDCKLRFHDHVLQLCKKSKCKNKYHGKSLPIYAFKSKESINESHFNNRFRYCLLVWMNHNRTLNNQTNSLQREHYKESTKNSPQRL